MTDALRHTNTFPAQLRELAILRVGWRYQAAYEVHHHNRIGRAVRASELCIEAARLGPETAGLSADERLVLRVTNELLDTHRLSQASRNALCERFSYNQLADFVLVISHYQQVCNFLNTFGVPIEGADPPPPQT